jgi:thioredoxin
MHRQRHDIDRAADGRPQAHRPELAVEHIVLESRPRGAFRLLYPQLHPIKDATIMTDSVLHLTDDTFTDAVAHGVTVVDFWAGWCGPCRAMAPQFEKAAQLRPQYRFAKVDVDAEPAIAGRYGIRSIPTLMVLREGEPVAAQSGVMSAEQLAEALDRIAAAPVAAGQEVKA